MKALTICQPYAHLIVHGDRSGALKRVENRGWYTNHRGVLYIHAGKSREWLDEPDPEFADLDNYGIPLERMAFGAIVGVAEVIDCVHIEKVGKIEVARRHPWLADHHHTNGLWCWVLDKVMPIGPVPWKGAQGLWDIDPAALERAASTTQPQSELRLASGESSRT